ncbi:ABC transporter substrate-binding protein [Bauldia sp.]|uniref:ABC transporter substrate-binding protein n=1 Tax=Bauldia sp. TaxID=2575872 RepID=UPI003BADABAB
MRKEIRRRKATFSALAAVIAAALGTNAAVAKDRIDVWSEFSADPGASAFAQIVADFNASQDEVEIVHTGYENTPYETTLKTSFLGGNPADIVIVNAGAVMYQFAEADQLVDLTDFVEERRDTILPGLESFYRFNGRDYAIPFELNVGNLLYFNTDMLAEHGIDPEQLNTWQGFVDAAQTFKDAGITPIAFGNSEGWPGNHIYNHTMLRLLGFEDYTNIFLRTLDPSVNSDVTWTDDVAIRGWEMYKELLDRGFFTAGYLADDYPTANALFLNGQAPLFTMGSWFMGTIADSGPEDLSWGVIPFPEVEGAPGQQSDLVTAGLVASISNTSEHPEKAKLFLEYMMSEPAQRIWAERTQKLPPYRMDNSDWAYSEQYRQIAGLLGEATAAVPFGDMIEDNACNVPWFWHASQGILSDSITPEEVGMGHEDCVARVRAERGFE